MKIYYYNSKFPEHGLNAMEVTDIQYTVRKNYKYMSGILSTYNINLECKEVYENIYNIYTPYEDKEIYVYDNHFGNQIIMSFNKELVQKWYYEDCKTTKTLLLRRLKKLGKVMGEKNE